jgi:hypothetical protein
MRLVEMRLGSDFQIYQTLQWWMISLSLTKLQGLNPETTQSESKVLNVMEATTS